jgi:propionyl-CoA synthetase
MKYIMGIGKGDTYFACSDIGWVVGHSFIAYGPLIAGATTVLFEGKPIGTPHAGVVWDIVEKHKVDGLFISPTALRGIRKEDPKGDFMKKANISSLKICAIAGERLDIHTFEWLKKRVSPDVLINDNYWQTESGWPIVCNYKDLHTFPSKAGSATKPAPGYEIHILDDFNNIITEPNKIGRLSIKLPLPPSFMPTVYGNDETFVKRYLTESPGYYTSGDAAYIDSDGYFHIVARIDDIINTAGHRLSTSQMEEILISHPDIAEAAVIGANDELKGEIPVGFVIQKEGRNRKQEDLEKELVKKIRQDIGAVASFKNCLLVEKLPKTRSGKIIRALLKNMVDGEPYKVTPTIEDETVVHTVEKKIRDYGFKIQTPP